MDSRADHLKKVGDGLFKKKRQWDELCQEIAENFYPLRADYTSSFTLGEDFSVDLMESFPVQARETLGNTISALLRQNEWFSVKTGLEDLDEEPENARWLEYATGHFRKLVYDRRANFVKATNEADMDWVTVGNPVLSVELSKDSSHLFFRDWHPKCAAWIENDVGKVDHLHRNMPMTARAMNLRWKGNVHSNVKRALETAPATEFNIRHIVLPFEEIYGDDKQKRRAYESKPFCSLYIDCDHDWVLGEAPLPVFNYVVPRWRTVSTFPQGFSPATINALPDGRMLQKLAMILLEEGEKAIDPPTIAKGEIFRNDINLYAGGMTYVDMEPDERLQDVFQTVSTAGSINVGLEMKQDVRNLINEAFLLNKIMLPPHGKTAYETQALLEEYRRAILPFTGPIEAEYHLPMLDVGFELASHAGLMDLREIPEALKQREEVTFEFDSPLSTSEGRKNVQAFQESVQILAGSSQFDETIPTQMNFKRMTKDAVRGTGAPADWFNDEETQQSEEEQAESVKRLQQAANFLREGAAVGQEVAGASVALKDAGIA